MTITTTEKKTYTGGVAESASQIVGYADSKNRVVRFTFTTDASGAGHIAWVLETNYLATSYAPGLRWYIGTDPESHKNAGATTDAYCGEVTKETVSGAVKFSGAADIPLLPNTTYYLWIFPSVATYGYYNLTQNQQAKVTPSGVFGVVYINEEAYQAYIDNGSGWDMCAPHIDNGTSWDACG